LLCSSELKQRFIIATMELPKKTLRKKTRWELWRGDSLWYTHRKRKAHCHRGESRRVAESRRECAELQRIL
jgi:hypothetical protein